MTFLTITVATTHPAIQAEREVFLSQDETVSHTVVPMSVVGVCDPPETLALQLVLTAVLQGVAAAGGQAVRGPAQRGRAPQDTAVLWVDRRHGGGCQPGGGEGMEIHTLMITLLC